jgi:hypothetical protein
LSSGLKSKNAPLPVKPIFCLKASIFLLDLAFAPVAHFPATPKPQARPANRAGPEGQTRERLSYTKFVLWGLVRNPPLRVISIGYLVNLFHFKGNLV